MRSASSFLGPLVRANKAGYTVDIHVDDRWGAKKCGRQKGIDVGGSMAGGGEGGRGVGRMTARPAAEGGRGRWQWSQ